MGERIVQLLLEGIKYDEICRLVGCKKGTISYHAKKNGLARQKQAPKTLHHFDWDAVQTYYDEGHDYKQCCANFGFSQAAWWKSILYKRIIPRAKASRAIPLEILITKIGKNYRGMLKASLIRSGLMKYECSICRIVEWQGKPISLQLDHINGDGSDNTIINLRLMCPNCHSQTETWGGRNVRRKRSLLRQQVSGEALNFV